MRWVAAVLRVAIVLVLMAAGLPARAVTTLPLLTGEVILTIDGLDPARFPGGTVSFDTGRLKALGQADLRTSTIWTDGVHDFSGVSLKDVVAFLGLTGGKLKAYALNDYAVEIPVSDAVADGPILAYAMDGQPMSVRDKGPIWVVYPYDQKPEYRSEVIFTRSIWQLERIEVQN
jgi:hypothetical protein